MTSEAPIVAWKFDEGRAQPVSPMYLWNLDEKIIILFPDGRVFDILKERSWDSVDEFEKEMAEVKATTKEAINESA